MIKSVIYRLAQVSVLRDGKLTEGMKLEILRELMTREDMEIWCEKQKEENAE